MWKCKKCKETCEDTFDSCWNCGTGRDGVPSAEPFQKASPSPRGGSQQNKRPSNSEHQNNGLDFKKLSQFISGFGIIVLVVGGIMFAANQPKTFSPASSQSGNAFDAIAQSVNNVQGQGQVMSDNIHAKEVRGNAIEVMIAGGVILFIGMGVSASVKKA